MASRCARAGERRVVSGIGQGRTISTCSETVAEARRAQDQCDRDERFLIRVARPLGSPVLPSRAEVWPLQSAADHGPPTVGLSPVFGHRGEQLAFPMSETIHPRKYST